MGTLPPRLVIGAPSSGAGKTTVATGLMAALRARGLAVASAKVGPDFIDPGYHSLATGRPGRNLDAWLAGPDRIPALAQGAAAGAEILVVEGVMGLFDGSADPDTPDRGSTAEAARLLHAPVVLVVDASAMSRSVAATVYGFLHFEPEIDVAAVILNKVGSDGHEVMLREALAPLGLPVLGALHRDDALTWRDRHLGLVPVVEDPDGIARALTRLGAAIERRCDVAGLMALAGRAPILTLPVPETADPVPAPPHLADAPQARPRIAVASGPAFSFVYPDNLEALENAGAEIVPFDPRTAERVPEAVDGLYAGGGFPEVFAAELAANRPLLDDVRVVVADRGVVTLAECGGLLWLARSLDGHPMAGVIPTDARMTDRLTLGYRVAEPQRQTPVGGPGDQLRGHEFHYSVTEPSGDALTLESRFGRGPAGFGGPHLLASYLHLHFGADQRPAQRLVAAAYRRQAGRRHPG